MNQPLELRRQRQPSNMRRQRFDLRFGQFAAHREFDDLDIAESLATVLNVADGSDFLRFAKVEALNGVR